MIQNYENGVKIKIKVQPRSSDCKIIGIHNGALKVKLRSPPLDGRANEELIELLARQIGISKSRISLIAGDKSKNKIVFVEGLTKEQANTVLIKR